MIIIILYAILLSHSIVNSIEIFNTVQFEERNIQYCIDLVLDQVELEVQLGQDQLEVGLLVRH